MVSVCFLYFLFLKQEWDWSFEDSAWWSGAISVCSGQPISMGFFNLKARCGSEV